MDPHPPPPIYLTRSRTNVGSTTPFSQHTNNAMLYIYSKRMLHVPLQIGKWHLGQQVKYQPTRQGFDHYFGLPYSVDMGFAYGNDTQEKESQAEVCHPVPIIHDEKIIEQPANYTTLTQRYVEHAEAFITNASLSGTPFFLYLPFSHVHVPQFAANPGKQPCVKLSNILFIFLPVSFLKTVGYNSLEMDSRFGR